jgi:hypothetical protein
VIKVKIERRCLPPGAKCKNLPITKSKHAAADLHADADAVTFASDSDYDSEE